MAEPFKTEIKDGIHFITISAPLTAQMEKEIESQVKKWLLESVELHVMDFAAVEEIPPALYRVFAGFKQVLKANKKFLTSLNLKPKIQSILRTDGVTGVFSPVSGLSSAKSMAGMAPKTKLDVKLLQPFVQATLQAMMTQVQLEATCGKPYVKDKDLQVEIAGVISLHNSDMPGSIAICFPKSVFLKIYEMMVGEAHTEIGPEIQDAAGELMNIIFGQAKTALIEQGVRLERAIPTVVAGNQVKLQLGERGAAIVLPFSSSIGDFHMEVALG